MSMPQQFDYSAFFSYRNRENDKPLKGFNGEMRLVKLICEELSEQTDSRMGLKVFLDNEEIRIGNLFDTQIPQKLCKSVCMVAFYTPTYIDSTKTYCSRELCGMLQIEKVRQPFLKETYKGLIIPIMFRCSKEHIIIEELRSRKYFSFDEFDVSTDGRRITPSKKFKKAIEEIAKIIHELKQSFHGQILDNCQDFKLPSASDIENWIKKAPHIKSQQVVTNDPFPEMKM